MFLCFPGTGKGEMADALEHIRVKIVEIGFQFEDKHIHATISACLIALSPNDSPSSLIVRSDQLLYQAKSSDKNCTISD